MRAILSDIHGNLEALTAVLADIERQGYAPPYNLGDTLGYGPNPVECLTLAMRMPVVLEGNFDNAVRGEPFAFCRSAEESVFWTQDELRATQDIIHEQFTGFLSCLRPAYLERGVLYVHGSARNPLNEYVFPEDIYNPGKMTKIGDHFDRLCFCGHTHIPGIFREQRPGEWEYLHPEEWADGFPVAGSKVICNVGSVGQPRDEDERACYATFDGDRIHLRRVEYDIDATVRKIYANPRLENFLGDRLREGR